MTGLAAVLLAVFALPAPVTAQVTAFKQSVAEAAARDEALSAFYRANDYTGIWTGQDSKDRQRRQALLQAIEESSVHGLPASRYDAANLMTMMKSARTPRDLGRVEVELSRTFLRLARDLQTGMLIPSDVDSGIVRAVPYRDPTSYLTNFTKSSPRGFFRALPPTSGEYARLLKEKTRLERQLGAGGWGPKVPANALKPGSSGNAVVALRNRLTLMGFLARSSSSTYDVKIEQAVQRFQAAHGLEADGTAGASTIKEINETVETRLASIMVAMERERWLNMPRGKRHVLVNLTDFSARIIDDDKVTFKTRAVVGKNTGDRRSPEFSDEMEYLEINPTWNVPRSIAVKEYLPQMQRNPGAAGHLKLYNARGQQVSRANINFGAYNARNFPFDLKQPPSSRNALGLVKFMFPNKHNIYLHDTPSKSLFQRNVRAFSHGCIRLQDPFDFAYAILAKQEADPKTFFHSILDTRQQTQVKLKKKVPVHIIYRTAFTQAKGPTQYRDDVYGRDARIWSALQKAGVSLRAFQG
ncbi:L,D-transpeptidase family protein [Pseudohalocynthiibacter aestuariivivens]|uniref:L,D-transpeptidase family protein n=2 Tax=Roseovarius pelagicus TaxID=2980108 RepID=A0ABY6DG03_9RHOB|nr:MULTISPECIES: L,D-transpeptidase family protein [Rhodobacterales]QIE47391.1 L,D-transpeptidase family protein [Pseudohalocynthiibacter aestuariivivens]UXX85081.1 L,D-transpeptidase family protein [Roseovarius pelagicus]